MQRCIVVNNHAVKKWTARFDKVRMTFTTSLVEIVVSHVFEVQRQGIIKRMVRDGTFFGFCRLGHEAVLKVRNFFQLDEFVFKKSALFVGGFLFQPEVNVVEHVKRGCVIEKILVQMDFAA